MNTNNFTVEALLAIFKEINYLEFKVVAGEKGLKNIINTEELNRPGLALAGYFDIFAYQRIQLFGSGEISYLYKLIAENKTENIYKLFEYNIPACIFTAGIPIPELIIDICNKRNIPVLLTSESSEKIITIMATVLSDIFAPTITMHGNFISINNMGVIITGKSGIGKSESMLGLIERGHKFICDDIVKIKKIRTAKEMILIGEPYVNYGPFIEIRGIGIINIAYYYGEGKILQSEKVDLIIELVEWDEHYNYDRLGINDKFVNILGINIPKKEIPVSSGRNISSLIEVAAHRELIRKMGYNPAEELNKKIISSMQKNKFS